MSTTTPIQHVQEHSFRHALRFYFERLLYTTRGRFAYLAGVAFLIYTRLGAIIDHGVLLASEPLFVQNPGFAESMIQVLGLTLSALSTVLVGMTIVLLLDVYEHEAGTVYDEPRHDPVGEGGDDA